MNFTPAQIEQANKLVGKKQKVFYPWEQKSIYRVVKKDEKGYYINYGGRKVGCRPQLNGMETDVVGFIALNRPASYCQQVIRKKVDLFTI